MRKLINLVGVAVLFSIAMPVFAESAPVYDADSMPQQFDNGSSGSDSSQQDVLPPPPGQEGVFVPAQSMPASKAAARESSSGGSADTRIRRMEQQIANLQNSDLTARLESLQTQLQTLRGQLEQVTHQLEQVQSQQKTMYTDVDKRLSQMKSNAASTEMTEAVKPVRKVAAAKTVKNIVPQPETTADASTDTAAAATTAASTTAATDTTTDSSSAASQASGNDQPNVAEEQQIYQTAYALIKAKKYDEAVNVLQGMLKKYPSGQFASNAHYWLGELYGLMGKNDQSLTEFSMVVKKYPDSPRISDAQLKIGLILAAQLKWPEAKTALKNVINHYPGTGSARLASDQLKQIKQAGH